MRKLNKPWKAISVTRTPRADLDDTCDVEQMVGYLVDEAGKPIRELRIGYQIFLRGSRGPGRHPWQFATGRDVVAVIDRPWGKQAILAGGDRLEVIETDLGSN
jgi:hypothetical protein